MPALPIWSVIVVVLSVTFIITSLLFCLFRYRRFPRSTVDPAEYSTKKQGFPTIASEAVSHSTQEKTLCPTTTTTTTSNTQPFTPTTTTTSSSLSPSSPSSSSCSILPSSAHAYSGEPLSEKHHEFDSKTTPASHHHQEHQKTDDFHISLPLPPPSTSFFADKMELNSDEATRMFEMYMSNSDKQAHSNQKDFVSIDLTSTNHPEDQKAAFYDTISHLQQKATSTIRSTLRQSLRRQKSSAKKTTIQQVFDPVIIPTAVATTTTIGNKDIFVDNHLPSSPPLVDPKYTAIKTLPPLSATSPPSPPISKDTNSNDSSSSINQEKNVGITLSSSPFQQLDEEADHQNSSNRTSLTSPRVSAEVSFGLDSTRTVKGRHLFDYNLDTMFSWPTGDSDEDEDRDDNTDNDDECHRVPEDDNNTTSMDANNDNVSITSGSVHRLVRDSTVVDTDHRSLAARSVSNSVRPSLHEMASWWSNDNESMHQDGVNDQNDSLSLLESSFDSPIVVQDPPQSPQKSTTSQSKSTSISKAMASYSSSSPTSTFSRATLNKFRAALANEVESDQESDNDDDDDDDANDNKLQQPVSTTTTLPEPHRVVEESSVKYAVPDDELAPITIPTFTEANKESSSPIPPSQTTTSSSSSLSTPSPSPPSSPTKTVYDSNSIKSSSIKSRPVSVNSTTSQIKQSSSPIAAVSSIRSNTRNSILNVSNGGGNSNVDSVRRVLQGTWNTHRYSDHGSIASSTRSNLSQGMSPPGSVNPRQLNQHLASLSLQSNGRHPIRPGLPTGFMNEDLLVPGTAIMGPQPTVSFSSSTVRTMIPEDEPIERHVGQKKATPVQKQQQKKPTPKQKQKKESVTKDQKQQQQQQQQSFGTMRTGRQQRGTMPWNSDASTKTKTGEKTPAQRERDRYLQSLKG